MKITEKEFHLLLEQWIGSLFGYFNINSAKKSNEELLKIAEEVIKKTIRHYNKMLKFNESIKDIDINNIDTDSILTLYNNPMLRNLRHRKGIKVKKTVEDILGEITREINIDKEGNSILETFESLFTRVKANKNNKEA